MFAFIMHPASEGDALELKWGTEDAQHRALIDLGRQNDYRRLVKMGAACGNLDLFVITHVDADHIAGAMPLVKLDVPDFDPAEVWFNGYIHVRNAKDRLANDHTLEPLSVDQGEKLSTGIKKFGWRWQPKFKGDSISVDIEPALPLTFNGLALTLLSPDDRHLAKLEPRWAEILTKESLGIGNPDLELAATVTDDREVLGQLNIDGLAAEPFAEDDSIPNGTSIAFVAEFDHRNILLAGDAYPSVMAQSLQRLGYSPAKPLRLDLFKLSHHGSKGNISQDLLRLIDCRHFAISTDGTRHEHPDKQAIARILKNDPDRPKTIYFNFRQPQTEIWDSPALKTKWNYTCVFPASPDAPVTVMW